MLRLISVSLVNSCPKLARQRAKIDADPLRCGVALLGITILRIQMQLCVLIRTCRIAEGTMKGLAGHAAAPLAAAPCGKVYEATPQQSHGSPGNMASTTSSA
jgi:hypothetical protein